MFSNNPLALKDREEVHRRLEARVPSHCRHRGDAARPYVVCYWRYIYFEVTDDAYAREDSYMMGKSRRSMVVHVIAFTTALGLAPGFTASAQQRKESQESLQADPYPTYIKVYSKDGKYSLTGNCRAKDLTTGQLVFRPRDPSRVKEITCTLTAVRYMTPDEKPKEEPMPSTYEEFVKQALRDDPKFVEELKRNPKKAREEWNKLTDRLCSKETIAGQQKRMQEIQMGPKMKTRYQTMINACLSKNFKTLIDEMYTEKSRTCSIWVETFTLDFKRIGKGKWLTGSEPQGLCNVVSIYELDDVRYGFALTVKNTVLTVGGTKSGVPELFSGACEAYREDTKEPMVWRLTNNNVFEPTCEFIKHDYISAPFP